MTGPLAHEAARMLLAAEALDALGGEERGALLAHLASCPTCTRELAELRDAAGALAYTPATTPERSERVRSRLLARAAADARFRSTPPAAPASQPPRSTATAPSRARPLPWLLAAAVALMAAALGAYVVREHDHATATRQQLATLQESHATLQSDLAVREKELAALTGPDVQVVEMTAGGVRPPSGRMFWDQASNRWTFIGHRLPQPAPGRAYQLWLITPGKRPLPAGAFTPGTSGDAVVRAEFALPRDSLAAVAVSVEPSAGVKLPTGPIILQGKP